MWEHLNRRCRAERSRRERGRLTTTLSAEEFRRLLKEANGNLKKIRLPPSAEELAEQEADYAIWEAHRAQIVAQLSPGGQMRPTIVPTPAEIPNTDPTTGNVRPNTSSQQDDAGARGTGTTNNCGGGGGWWALAGLLLAMLAFTGYVLWAYKQIGAT